MPKNLAIPKEIKGDKSLQLYFNEINRLPLLRPEKQLELLQRYRETGDVDARKRLTESVLKLVVKIAFRYPRSKSIGIMDLIQEGNTGIFVALEKFDPSFDVRFGTYAGWWIRQKIRRFLDEKDTTIRIPVHQKANFRKLQKISGHLKGKLGREPTAEELSEKTKLSPKKIELILARGVSRTLSLDEMIPGTNLIYADIVRAEVSETDDIIMDETMKLRVKEVLAEVKSTLSERDKIILEKRLETTEPLTLQEIGDELDISRERVRQVEANLKTIVKERLERELAKGSAQKMTLSTQEKKEIITTAMTGKAVKKKAKEVKSLPKESPVIVGPIDRYEWTIARGVHVELRSNVPLRREHFEKLSQFMTIMAGEK
jgi:RNA polymerase primary sigma factor